MFVYPYRYHLVCSLYSAAEHILQTSVSQVYFLPPLDILGSTSPCSLWAFHSPWWAISYTIKMRRAQVALCPGNGVAQKEVQWKKNWFKKMCIHIHRQPQSCLIQCLIKKMLTLYRKYFGGGKACIFIISSASMGSILVYRHGVNWKVITKPGLKRRQRTVAFVAPATETAN